jgi:hypothetical protein
MRELMLVLKAVADKNRMRILKMLELGHLKERGSHSG